MNKKILITGISGYIGSHIAVYLKKKGYEVDGLDRNQNQLNIDFKYQIDLEKNYKKIHKKKYDCIIHLASYTLPRESFNDINKYIFGNLKMTVNLLNIFPNFSKFIFFSTANLYQPSANISENSYIETQSPYAESKLTIERYLKQISTNSKSKFAIFRLFNAAGGDVNNIFKYKIKQTNNLLIPSLIKSYINKKQFKINGIDYKTYDGTCIRDFIHVYDISRAIIAFIELKKVDNYNLFNLGSSKGYSVREIVNKFLSSVDGKLKIKESGKQKGDPSEIICDSKKIKNTLNWKPVYSDIDIIISSSINNFYL